MTYITFLAIFLAPPILLLAWRNRKLWAPYPLFLSGLVLMCCIAFIYTTPWDNYLVAKGVWGYDMDRVLGRMGHVPIEEYAFFILQPIMTGLWLLGWLPRFRAQLEKAEPYDQPQRQSRFIGVAFWLFMTYLGFACLTVEWGKYFGLILIWASPVLAFQWAFGGHHLWKLKNLWIMGWLPPTLYLWVADRIAIEAGIWYFSKDYLSGLLLLGLPAEEALFFLVTNLLVVQGLVLYVITLQGMTPASIRTWWAKRLGLLQNA